MGLSVSGSDHVRTQSGPSLDGALGQETALMGMASYGTQEQVRSPWSLLYSSKATDGRTEGNFTGPARKVSLGMGKPEQ